MRINKLLIYKKKEFQDETISVISAVNIKLQDSYNELINWVVIIIYKYLISKNIEKIYK